MQNLSFMKKKPKEFKGKYSQEKEYKGADDGPLYEMEVMRLKKKVKLLLQLWFPFWTTKYEKS